MAKKVFPKLMVVTAVVVGTLVASGSTMAAVSKVYWTDRNAATLSATDLGSGATQVLVPGTGGRLQDVDLDTTTGILYFADWGPLFFGGGGSISQVNGDGTGLATVFNTNDAVHQLALDEPGQRLYFTRAVSYDNHEISRVDYTGLNYTVFLSGGGGGPGWFPSGLAVDFVNSLIYWGDIGVIFNPPNGSVNRMTTAGAAQIQLTPHVNGRGRGYALEQASQTIFFTAHDPQSPGTGGALFSYDIVGGIETLLISDPDTGYWDVEIDPVDQRIWWTDYGRGQIRSAKFDGSDVQIELSGLTNPYGLALEIQLCEPDPRTQGYWHRQCLGVPVADGGITPGRNSNGRGPTTVLEPDFDKLLPDVSVKLGNLLGPQNGGSCSDGMVADPPSDPCQKAVKQFTALLFNLESDRLQNSCEVDLSAEGCSSTNIGDLVDELAGLINSGDPDNCKVAADCAAAVNEGGGGLGEDLFLSAGDIVSSDPTAPNATGSGLQGEASPAETGARSVAGTTSVVTQKDASAVESPSAREVPAGDPVAGIYLDLRSLERHLAVLDNDSAPERARTVSTDALLTALSGGYEPEIRIEFVKELLDEVEESMLSLLAAHLRDIRDEARDFGKEELAKEAEGLLKRLQPSDE